ncbi:hypothetical protein EGY05_21995 [Chryseobacterium arthrosphaerae]|uniref:Uncharacterized protein n=1 Tax=Chryseobacterium arthrosphaerae TaxID=651561 RepID=A0A3S0VKE5_9FLAO|nr:hypothetical protein [Chryseobacterium arthrosphaerae]AYZ14430.1 hypothetical protein EGY05_21995 [Chryseobacterium arthrosphaerae]RTZ50330.1 hypothetical protein EJ377_10925 [Chryseobacterium arthrosphaerae]
MKTPTSHKQYTEANNVLIFIVSVLLGYNIYRAMHYPEKSDLLLCIVLLALTSATVQKYGRKNDHQDIE